MSHLVHLQTDEAVAELMKVVDPTQAPAPTPRLGFLARLLEKLRREKEFRQWNRER